MPWQACVLQTSPADWSCRTFFPAVSAVVYMLVMTAESFLSGLRSYRKYRKDLDDFYTWKTCRNTKRLLKSGCQTQRGGAQMNDGDAAKLHTREQTPLSLLSVLFLSRKNPTKNILTMFSKSFLVMHFPSCRVHISFIPHEYKVTFLTATKLQQSFLKGFFSFLDSAQFLSACTQRSLLNDVFYWAQTTLEHMQFTVTTVVSLPSKIIVISETVGPKRRQSSFSFQAGWNDSCR